LYLQFTKHQISSAIDHTSAVHKQYFQIFATNILPIRHNELIMIKYIFRFSFTYKYIQVANSNHYLFY